MKKNIYLDLFLSTFTISAFTLGGGYVIVPLMRKKYVETLKWLEDKEMLDMIAIASSTPGPIAINSSILVGHKMAGIPGALVTLLGTITPPLLTLSIVYQFYAAFRDNFYVESALWGMSAAVAAMLADAVFNMCSVVIREKDALSNAVMALSFIAVFFFNVHIVLVIAVCAALGFIRSRFEAGRAKG
ncbi:MAG: chromate transporter [Clostridiales bacterium]|nr:chromate transporter [Clostridiales bacterium]